VYISTIIPKYAYQRELTHVGYTLTWVSLRWLY